MALWLQDLWSRTWPPEGDAAHTRSLVSVADAQAAQSHPQLLLPQLAENFTENSKREAEVGEHPVSTEERLHVHLSKGLGHRESPCTSQLQGLCVGSRSPARPEELSQQRGCSVSSPAMLLLLASVLGLHLALSE